MTTQNNRFDGKFITINSKEMLKERLLKRLEDSKKIRKAREKRIRRSRRGMKQVHKSIGTIIDNGIPGRWGNDFEFVEAKNE